MKTPNHNSTPRPNGRQPHGGVTDAAVSHTSSPKASRIPAAVKEDPRSRALLASPEYIRYPAPGNRDPLTGLSRSTLTELVIACAANGHKPPVRSVLLKKRGATRGIRLIHVPSLLAYLNRLATESGFDGPAFDDDVDCIETGGGDDDPHANRDHESR